MIETVRAWATACVSRRRNSEPLKPLARTPLSLRLWPRSLTFRVIAFSTVWAIVTLVVIFTLITTLYRQASERGFESLLSAHLFNLIGSVGISDSGALTGAPDLGDLRFSSRIRAGTGRWSLPRKACMAISIRRR